MPDDPRVRQLLEELFESNRTPEEVCASCIELLPVVRTRWWQVCQARAELDDLFPPEAGTADPDLEGASHPTVPGYEIESVLGRGGMGVVFRARHLRLNRVVALKMALAGAYAGPHERERFRREAEAVAALRHPNVVQIYEVGDSDGRPYFTMEYVEGGSLAQKLAGTPLPAHEAAALLAPLAGAIHSAHASGIVHRDLKPANVLLDPDGSPKISDFGLACRLGGGAGLTLTGTAMGTPSYMAPEQAGGAAAGPAADVYALGAILYELLTGRPPFRAATGAETIQQVLAQAPVPPSRLNGKVPRDLETVCLKCLSKEARLRYASAAALADDLGRFLRGEAIAARPEGRLARLVRRVRLRPVLSAAVAVAALSTFALFGGVVWTLSDREVTRNRAEAERAATEAAAGADLRDMGAALQKSSWPEARAALDRAKIRLRDRGADDLHRRISQGERELDLAARLEGIRLERAVSTGDRPDWERSARDYEAVFRAAGLARLHDDAGAAADRIKGLDIRAAVTDALDDWALCVFLKDRSAQVWLLTVAGGADPDASDWRAKARAQKRRPAAATTAALAEDAVRAVRCDPLLLGLGRDITFNFKDPIPFLMKVQQAHPGDLYANLELAEQLVWHDRSEEAVRYYQSALAVRPEAPAICNKLALVLGQIGRKGEAVEYLRRAARFAPSSAEFRRNLAVGLLAEGRHAEALEACRAAIRLDPVSARSRVALGDVLSAMGQGAGAASEYRSATELEPALTDAWRKLRDGALRRGQLEDARAAWRAALGTPQATNDDWYGYVELCLFLGREEEYYRTRGELLTRFGATRDPRTAERYGRGCLLRPASGDELRRAAALAERAGSLDRTAARGFYPFYQFVRGLAAYRQDRYGRSIELMRGDASQVLGPAPRLVLAMALHRSGREGEARNELAAAVSNHDWRGHRVRDQDDWIGHVLRREAETMMLPNLPAFLEGKYQPADNAERFALLGVCQFTNRSFALARLYADIFAAAPGIGADYRAGHRFSAACAAARSGNGSGIDATELGDAERTKWRARAREWMRADLALWSQSLDGATPSDRDAVREKLTQWRSEPDLTGLRDTANLARIPEGERKECVALWDEVAAVLDRCGQGK